MIVRRGATLALAIAGATAVLAHAQPTALAPPAPTTVDGCGFDAAALAAALTLERQPDRPPAPPITVRCAGDTATITIHHPDRPPTVRGVDLVDVPAPLAPRVVALVAVAATHEAPREPTREPAAAPPPPAPPSLAPTTAPSSSIERVRPPLPARTSLLASGVHLRPLGVSARGLARIHDATTTLWGAGAAVTLGPTSLGLTAAGTHIDHALGRVTPWLVAVEAGVTVACVGAACVAARAELGRIAVTATASDPMTVAARPLAATYVHGALELSLAARLGGLDVAATGGLGTCRGVIARVDADAVAVVAGWTFTGGLEVRR